MEQSGGMSVLPLIALLLILAVKHLLYSAAAARFCLAFSDHGAEIQCEECIPPPSVEFSCLNRHDRLPFLPPGAEVKSLHRVSCSHFVAQSDFLDVNSVRMSLPS